MQDSDSRARCASAHDYAQRGWRVLALHGVNDHGGCTCSDDHPPASIGKHPINARWQNTPPLTGAQIDQIWERNPWANVGIVTGEGSGLFALDVDPDKGGFDSLRSLVEAFGPLTDTRVHTTGSGGWHYLYALPFDFTVTNKQQLKGYPGLDVRGAGGQIVAPPSRTPKGMYYVTEDRTLAQAPDWLLAMLRPEQPTTAAVTAADVPAVADLDAHTADRLSRYADTARRAELARLRALTEQGWQGPPWNSTCFAVACTLVEIANSGWNPYTLEQAYTDLREQAPRDGGFGDSEINKIWGSALTRIGNHARLVPDAPLAHQRQADAIFASPDVRTDPKLITAPLPEPTARMRTWDDLGNALRMVDHYGPTLRWIDQIEKWAVYADGRWAFASNRVVQGLAHRLIENLPETEGRAYSDDQRDKFLTWVKQQRMSARIQACVAETRGRPEIQASLEDFDAHPLLLNASNGVVDLATGELRAHDPSLLLMQHTEVVYDPTADCPEWRKFLERVVPTLDMQLFLQRIVGYSITGKTTEQAMFLHWGNGANGKSVFLQVMSHIAGEYGQVVPRSTLLVKSGEEHPTSVARMAGKRFLQMSETAAGRRLDEEQVKGLTGGERQTARYMNKDFFDFTPTGKIHYVTNFLPRLTDADSTWRRLHLFSWPVKIPREEWDLTLAERIIATEASGVLAWAVRGTRMWLDEGLQPPAPATDALAKYRADQDAFAEFLEDRTVLAPGNRCTVAALYDAYVGWAFRAGLKKPLTRQAFSTVLKERGFETYRTNAERGFVGLRVLAVDMFAEARIT